METVDGGYWIVVLILLLMGDGSSGKYMKFCNFFVQNYVA